MLLKSNSRYFKDKRPELNEQITTWLTAPQTQRTFLQATEDLLLSDTVLEEEVVFALETLYNQLRQLSEEWETKSEE